MAQNQRILLVDDTKRVLETLGIRLQYEGYEVATARDVEKALESLAQNMAKPFDLVITDYQMEGEYSGVDLIRYMKSEEEYKAIPAIFFAATQNSRIYEIALEAGATTFFRKHSGPDKLIAYVNQLLRTGKLRSL